MARRLVTLVIVGLVLAVTLVLAPNGEPAKVRLVFVGDMELSNTPGEKIAKGEDPFADFADVLADCDASIGNLECAVATTGVPVKKPWTFRADPRVLPVVAKHLTAVNLANNHSGDFGHDAFRECLSLLPKHNILYYGGGSNIREARTPLILKRNGLKIAMIGANDFKPRSFEAGPTWPGVAWCVDEQLEEDVRAAREVHHADVVLPYLHWGWEEYPANNRQKALARKLIDAGADAVIGGHPHVVQEVEIYRGKLIVYSLGNFIFDGFKTKETLLGWVLRMTVTKAGVVSWETIPCALDTAGIPHRARDVESPSGRAGDPKIYWKTERKR
jgi:poly-gamma-glutamate capsule biosynthesis protein CapA/YwtB (metallophosphatase superfamily)